MLLDLADSWEEVQPWPRVADGYEPFDAAIPAEGAEQVQGSVELISLP